MHFIQVVNGERSEYFLCLKCADALGIGPHMGDPEAGPPELIGELLEQHKKELESIPDITCPECGYKLRKFHNNGLLGCPACYDAFLPYLKTVLRRYHGTNRHVLPDKKFRGERGKIIEIEHRLADAVRKENFEKAAQLRDEITRVLGESQRNQPPEIDS